MTETETMGIGEDGEVKVRVAVAGEALEEEGLVMEMTEMVMMEVMKHRPVEGAAREGRGKGRERGPGPGRGRVRVRVEVLTATVSEALIFRN